MVLLSLLLQGVTDSQFGTMNDPELSPVFGGFSVGLNPKGSSPVASGVALITLDIAHGERVRGYLNPPDLTYNFFSATVHAGSISPGTIQVFTRARGGPFDKAGKVEGGFQVPLLIAFRHPQGGYHQYIGKPRLRGVYTDLEGPPELRPYFKANAGEVVADLGVPVPPDFILKTSDPYEAFTQAFFYVNELWRRYVLQILFRWCRPGIPPPARIPQKLERLWTLSKRAHPSLQYEVAKALNKANYYGSEDKIAEAGIELSKRVDDETPFKQEEMLDGTEFLCRSGRFDLSPRKRNSKGSDELPPKFAYRKFFTLEVADIILNAKSAKGRSILLDRMTQEFRAVPMTRAVLRRLLSRLEPKYERSRADIDGYFSLWFRGKWSSQKGDREEELRRLVEATPE